MRRTLIVSINPFIRIEFKDYLTSILGDYITFDTASLKKLPPQEQLADYQCILFSSARVKEEFPFPLPENTTPLVCARTFNHSYLDQIIRIPPGQRVYVINDVLSSTLEIIREFQASGLTQFQYVPLTAKSTQVDPSIRYAITIGEPELVPKHITNVINIGNRIIDISTVHDLCSLFALPSGLCNRITRNYILHILRSIKVIGSYYSSYVHTHQLLLATAASLPDHLCLLNQDGAILLANKAFLADWGIPENTASGRLFSNYLPAQSADFTHLRTGDLSIENASGSPLVLSIQELVLPGYDPVFLLTSRSQAPPPHSSKNLAGKTEPQPDSKLYSGSSASAPSMGSPIERQRLAFLDIITASAAFHQVLSQAKQLALYDFPVLIQGEHGTQKKLLAKAIHKSSSRRTQPFVSLNQMLALSGSSLPEILKSANHGTLLAADVDLLSPRLQDFLIQLLQENGSGLDIRIIATSAADLYQLSQTGDFRQELFYLLGAASLSTLPLRKRPEDIPLLLEQFFHSLLQSAELPLKAVLSEELYQFLLSYSYPGNVQELLSLCRHLFSLYAAHPLTMAQLPAYLTDRLPPAQARESVLIQAVLDIIQKQPRIGRGSIQKALAASGTEISDGRLRGLLRELAADHLIVIHRTKGGCEITEQGALALSPSALSGPRP